MSELKHWVDVVLQHGSSLIDIPGPGPAHLYAICTLILATEFSPLNSNLKVKLHEHFHSPSLGPGLELYAFNLAEDNSTVFG